MKESQRPTQRPRRRNLGGSPPPPQEPLSLSDVVLQEPDLKLHRGKLSIRTTTKPSTLDHRLRMLLTGSTGLGLFYVCMSGNWPYLLLFLVVTVLVLSVVLFFVSDTRSYNYKAIPHRTGGTVVLRGAWFSGCTLEHELHGAKTLHWALSAKLNQPLERRHQTAKVVARYLHAVLVDTRDKDQWNAGLSLPLHEQRRQIFEHRCDQHPDATGEVSEPSAVTYDATGLKLSSPPISLTNHSFSYRLHSLPLTEICTAGLKGGTDKLMILMKDGEIHTFDLHLDLPKRRWLVHQIRQAVQKAKPQGDDKEVPSDLKDLVNHQKQTGESPR